jgi:hypothetical protein
MDPKRIANEPPALTESAEPEIEIWEPPFERWQRLTEALIAESNRARDNPTSRA